MSTNFPSSLDTSTTIPAEGASTPLATNHVTAHQNIQDAIEAIEAKVGADSSAVTASHDYKLGEVTGSDKAVSKTATQTLTNKTLTSPVITSPTLNLGSDAEGDTYYRNAAGALVRLPRGTDNYIYKMNGNVPNWEVEATVSAATESAEGISRLATAAQITAGTASESGFPLVVTPDQLALSAPTFSAANLTNFPVWSIAPARTSISQAGTSASETTTNVDTTIVTTFTPKSVTIYYTLKGFDSGGADFFTTGIATYDGTTLRGNMKFVDQGATATTVTSVFDTNAPTAGTYSGGAGTSNQVTLSVQSVSATTLVVRASFHAWGNSTTATADFNVVAIK